MDGYISLKEAAELEKTEYDSYRKRVQRAPDRFLLKPVKNQAGGKDLLMISVMSLSPEARKAWEEKEQLKSLCQIPEPEADQETEQKRPWYMDYDIGSYIEENREAYFKAIEIRKVVEDFREYRGKDRTKYAEHIAGERLGKDARTLFRYEKNYKKAKELADRKEAETGCSHEYYLVLCFCRKPKEAGNFPSFTPELKQLIKNIWFNKEFAQNQGTREMCYEKLEAVAALNHWKKIPSYSSVCRYIDDLMKDGKMKQAWLLNSKGMREFRNKIMVKGSRDTMSLQVMEVVMGDEHTFDCFVTYQNPQNGKVEAIRPKLVAWIDARSKAVMGDVMCKDANSDILKESILKMIYSDVGGVPKLVYIDNGKDYTAKDMTGVDRNIRSNKQDLECIEFDSAAKGFYQSIGIEGYHRARPYEPWSKTQIERFFRTICNRFSKWMGSYVGTLTGSKTDAKIDKDIKKLMEQGKLLTLEEFYGKWTEWLEGYMNKKHSTHKKNGEKWLTPLGVFQNAERYHKAVPPRSFAKMLMLKAESVYVYPVGIKRWKREYRSDELCFYIGKTVDIKYDPNDVATIYVFDKNGKYLCEAYEQELLQIKPGVTQKKLESHIAMQNRQIRAAKEVLEAANRPFTELGDGLVGFDSTVGGIDLMIEGKGKPKAKIVQLPQESTYKQGFRKPENSLDNPYMERMAKEAMEELDAMNH